jgi:hypothetical protein
MQSGKREKESRGCGDLHTPDRHQDPWPTWPTEGVIELSWMRHRVKQVIRAAGLRDELSFASFRHGGFLRRPATPN